MDHEISLRKENERVEAALKAMKAELKAFVNTGDVIWNLHRVVSMKW